MNTFIVRVYRTEKNDPKTFVGVVEEVEKQGKRAFTNLEELWAILNPAKKGKDKRDRDGKR